mgnify:CR=1 FL=1
MRELICNCVLGYLTSTKIDYDLVKDDDGIFIDFALCLHDQRLMYLSVPTLDNEKIRGIHPDVTPAIPGRFVALDLELCHGPVAVVAR